MDAAYYQDEFVVARLRVTHSGLETVPLAGDGGLVQAWIPGRTTLVFTLPPEKATPYLRAHDALERVPPFERYVALQQMKDGDALRLREGWIVLTCSGRNFGPCAWVSSRLAQAAMTDIMRLVPRSEEDGFYALAFLTTANGQTLIRRDPAGSVINHLAPDDLQAIPVPLVPEPIRNSIITRFRRSVTLFEEASTELLSVDADLRAHLGLDVEADVTWPSSEGHPRVIMRTANELADRLDAEFYSERHWSARNVVASNKHTRLDEIAKLLILGRYKRYYVDPPHGTPILSSGQLHQFHPVALKNISDRSFDDPDAYRLQRGWSLVACDGRSEGDLGRPGYVSSLWDGWMASNHLMRVVPKRGIHAGYLHAALRLREVQVQLKSIATGSVIDALDEVTCGPVLVPRVGDAEKHLGKRVDAVYEKWAEAYRLQMQGANEFEAAVGAAYEAQTAPAAVFEALPGGDLRIMSNEKVRERIRDIGGRLVAKHGEALEILADHDPDVPQQ
jgi:hypothetical protein